MASASLPRVLRIPRTDGAGGDFILLHVSSTGRHPHDLKLIGTEGTDVFSVKVKHNQTSTLKVKNFSGTQAQWEETLSAVLLGGEKTEFTRDVEAVTEVQSESSITITIRKSIEGIKKKLGMVTLAYTEDEETSLFEWCGLTINAQEESSRELADMRHKLREKDEETKKLNETLAELVNVKNAHEDDLIQKFSILLNEKKLKIRDQQRLLASANVDPGKLEEVERNRIPGRDSPPRPSRTRKRKAGTAVKDESDDTDGGFEKMDVDNDAEELERNSADEDERRTEDEHSTADEDSGDDVPAVQLPTRNTNNAKASGSGTASKSAPEPELPPKRDLPFTKKPAAPAPKPTAPVEGSETESDDDEL